MDIGLKSFEAVTIFAPSILLGLYWKGGNKKGAIAGIIAGFSVWIYTLLIPALMRAGIIEPGGVMEAVFNSRLLNPTALFGLAGPRPLEPLPVLGAAPEPRLLRGRVALHPAVRRRDPPGHHLRGFLLAASVLAAPPARQPYSEIEDILGQYIGKHEAREAVERFFEKEPTEPANRSPTSGS